MNKRNITVAAILLLIAAFSTTAYVFVSGSSKSDREAKCELLSQKYSVERGEACMNALKALSN